MAATMMGRINRPVALAAAGVAITWAAVELTQAAWSNSRGPALQACPSPEDGGSSKPNRSPGPSPGLLCQPGNSPPKAELDGPPLDEEGSGEEPTAGFRKLTPQEINRIRYMELRGMRGSNLSEQPDRVTCKIPRQVIDDFLLEMEGQADFITAMTGNRDAGWQRARQAFRKLTAPQKLHQIAYYKGVKYADRVEITADPEVFVEFKKSVLPVLLRGCASSTCHGSANREDLRFVLRNDPKKSAAVLYANFLMLNEIDVNGRPLIDRAQPENSLLLTYMLPVADVKPEMRHPESVKYKPVFQTRTSPGYRRIQSWIRLLKHPAEDYGVRLLGSPSTTTAEAEAADDAEQSGRTEPMPEKKEGDEPRPPPLR